MDSLLIWLSGASPEILRRCPERERVRYWALGGAVLMAGAISGIGVVSALRTIATMALAFAIPLGLVSSFTFIIIGRLLISAIRRHTKVRAYAAVMIPTLLIALLAAASIAAAGISHVDQPAVDKQIIIIEQQNYDNFLKSAGNSSLNEKIAVDQEKIIELNAEIASDGQVNPDPQLKADEAQLASAQTQLQTYTAQLDCQLYGVTNHGIQCIPGSGPEAELDQARVNYYQSLVVNDRRLIQQRQQRLQVTAARANASLPLANQTLTQDQAALASILRSFRRGSANPGVSIRFSALTEVSSHESATVAWLLLLISLAFLAFLPILLKALQNRGPETEYERNYNLDQQMRLLDSRNTVLLQEEARNAEARTTIREIRQLLDDWDTNIPETREEALAVGQRLSTALMRDWENRRNNGTLDLGDQVSGLEGIFLVLGTAVVKASVRVWLRDGTFTSDVGDSVIDLIKDKIGGNLEQRQIRRFFEDLEVPVAKRMRAMCATEFRGLPENEWNAAVLAAGESFDRATLTAEDLFRLDLDPLSLERQVRRDRGRAVRDLSASGAELYDRCIGEGCACVIEIADKLPHFQLGAFTELLRRERQILELISGVLDRIPSQAAGQELEARFVTACRRHIATKLDRLELLGLDFESGWYPLSVAYVSLRTEQHLNSGGEAIEQLLAGAQRLLLAGRAGSGKTTVLQWLAVRAARSDFSGALAGLNGYFPFFIRLREYVGRPLPQPEEFLAGSAPLLVQEVPDAGWFRRQLDSGRALVLVDGVDELPVDERKRASDWMSDLVERFPDARYVITARPAAMDRDWLAGKGFVYSSLETMPPALIRQFVRNWHEAARGNLLEDEERESLAGYERSLQAEIERDHYLRDLADTPLLAGLLCAINQHLRSKLPRRRSEIYERALVMLDQREHARGISTSTAQLDLSTKNQVLADLALWMTRKGESEVDVQDATRRVGRSLSALQEKTMQPEAVFRLLLERSGLLRETVAGRVDFVHRTFQEYLAARAAVDEDVMEELVRNSDNAQWGEVVVMAAGQANQTQSASLLRGLLKRDWRGQIHLSRRVLAVACLQETLRLETNLRRDVEAIIPQLLPPQTMEQAEQLSAACPQLVPLLDRFWPTNPGRAPEIIRAASLVGGRKAMQLISNIAMQTQNQEIASELARAWQYFEPDEYARFVLAPAEIKSMRVSDMRTLRALSIVPSVEILQVDTETIDLGMVTGFPRLRELTLNNPAPAELSKLRACPALRSLTILGCSQSNLSHIPPLASLKSLSVSSTQSLSLAGIERQRDVFQLSILGCKRLTGMARLRDTPNLDTLWISHVRDLDLAGFQISGPGLLLYLSDCSDVDLSPVGGLNGLSIRHDKATRLRNVDKLGAGVMLEPI